MAAKMWTNLSKVMVIAVCLSAMYVLLVATQHEWRTTFTAAASTVFGKGSDVDLSPEFNTTALKADGTEHGGQKRCPHPPPNMIGQIPVDQSNTTFGAIEAAFPEVTPGGRCEPPNCISYSKVAILVPYRDREEHLKIFLRHMHRFLQKQLVNYTIYVIEQTNGTKFNRGFLFNVGVQQALNDRTFDCFIFHDVDLLPENENNLYHCSDITTHMSTGLSKWNYSVIYPQNFGGVIMMLRQDFIRINGFSNRFHGWGAEDDDQRLRLINKGIKFYKQPTKIGRYTSLDHRIAKPNPDRFNMLSVWSFNRCKEGFNTMDYQLLETERRPLYTWFLIKPNYID